MKPDEYFEECKRNGHPHERQGIKECLMDQFAIARVKEALRAGRIAHSALFGAGWPVAAAGPSDNDAVADS